WRFVPDTRSRKFVPGTNFPRIGAWHLFLPARRSALEREGPRLVRFDRGRRRGGAPRGRRRAFESGEETPCCRRRRVARRSERACRRIRGVVEERGRFLVDVEPSAFECGAGEQ